MTKGRATKRKKAFVKKAKRAKADKRPAPHKPKRQEKKMAETKSSHSLGNAAEAEEKALKKGGGGSSSASGRDNDEDVKPQSFTYNPDPGDPEETVAFGKLVKKGESVEFTDPSAIRKLKGNTAFMDDSAKKKLAESRAAAVDAETKHRASVSEQDLVEAMGDPDKDVDTRIPEVPQAGSIEMAKKRKLYEQLVMRENERPDEGTPASRRKKADE
jgi:hypothetical protein